MGSLSDLYVSLSHYFCEASVSLLFTDFTTAAIVRITDVSIRNSGTLSEVEITTAKVAGDEIRAAIFFMMAKSGWPILEFRSLDPTLEEVFLSITAG